jgi:hypothetical protein
MRNFWSGFWAGMALVIVLLAIILSCTIPNGNYRHQGTQRFFTEQDFQYFSNKIVNVSTEIRMFSTIQYTLTGTDNSTKPNFWISSDEITHWVVVYDYDSAQKEPSGFIDVVSPYHSLSYLILLLPSFVLVMSAFVSYETTPKRNKKGQFSRVK